MSDAEVAKLRQELAELKEENSQQVCVGVAAILHAAMAAAGGWHSRCFPVFDVDVVLPPQRTTIGDLEEQVYQVEELEEKVVDLTQRLEEAENLTPDGAAKRIRTLEEFVIRAWLLRAGMPCSRVAAVLLCSEVLKQSKAVVEQGEKNMKVNNVRMSLK